MTAVNARLGNFTINYVKVDNVVFTRGKKPTPPSSTEVSPTPITAETSLMKYLSSLLIICPSDGANTPDMFEKDVSLVSLVEKDVSLVEKDVNKVGKDVSEVEMNVTKVGKDVSLVEMDVTKVDRI